MIKNLTEIVLRDAINILNKWQELPNLDILFDDYRKQNHEHTNKTIALIKDYFRFKSSIEWILQKQHSGSIRGRLKKILYLSLVRIFHQNLSSNAAVNSAVEYTKNKYNKHEAGFVNKLLRKISQLNLDEILQQAPEHIKYNIPKSLLKKWRQDFPNELDSLLSNLNKTPGTYARSNTPITAQCLEKISPSWAPDFLFYKVTDFQLFKKEQLQNCYIQDPATALSISFLAPKKGESIADMCAAPGGKSLMIADLTQGEAKLTCFDNSKERMVRLKENLQRYPQIKFIVQNSMTYKADEKFDKILLDVPCSNTGILQRKPDAKWNLNIKDTDELMTIQKNILVNAARNIKDNGTIIYSTCSLDPQENELLVQSFIKDHPKAKLVRSKQLLPSENNDGAYAAEITF